MHPRYSSPDIDHTFSDVNRLVWWLEIEAEAAASIALEHPDLADLAERTATAIRSIPSIPDFATCCVHAEYRTKHEVTGFLVALEDHLEQHGCPGVLLHLGLTSSDVTDTALCLMLKEAHEVVQRAVHPVETLLKSDVAGSCLGYTHGVPAGPLASHARHHRTLRALGKRWDDYQFEPHLSGPLGDHATLSELRAKAIARALGLTLPKAPYEQCSPRIKLAGHLWRYLESLVLPLEKLALDLRLLVLRGDVIGIPDDGETGSSSMPHKVNPVDLEQACGLARLLRSYHAAIADGTATWLERDISHSCVERTVLPDFFHALMRLLTVMAKALERYQYRPQGTPSPDSAARLVRLQLDTARRLVRAQTVPCDTVTRRSQLWDSVRLASES